MKDHWFKHYKTGETYFVEDEQVINSTNGPDDGVPMVLYFSTKNTSQRFVRPHAEFFGEVDGVKRFQPCKRYSKQKRC